MQSGSSTESHPADPTSSRSGGLAAQKFGKKRKREEVVEEPSRQFLTFMIAGELYGMDINSVREIIEFNGLRAVPLMPDFVQGVINLRGEVVPVIDCAVRFGKEPIKTQRRTCILIVECSDADSEVVVGLSVDSVSEVVELRESELAPAPAFGSRIRSEFIEGVATIGDHFAVLVSAEHVLSIQELAALVESSIDGN